MPKINTYTAHCLLLHPLNGLRLVLLFFQTVCFYDVKQASRDQQKVPVWSYLSQPGARRKKDVLCGLVRHEIKHVIRTNSVWLRD